MTCVSIALAFLFNLVSFTTAIMETNFPTGTLITGSSTEYKVQLRMLGATPAATRLTQCTGFVLTNQLSDPIYAVQFTGHAPSTLVHHLVLYGCNSKPSNPCACALKSRTTLFSSTFNTPAIRFSTLLREKGGMIIGGTSSVKYVFLEAHYHSASTKPDISTGVDVQYILTAPINYLSVRTIMATGSIPPGKTQATVDACTTGSNRVIVGYQIHAHSLATVGGTVREIGRWNPRFPHSYFQVNSFIFATTGRALVRCVYNSVGQTQNVYTIGVPGQKGTEMCMMNILYSSTTVPGTNPFVKGSGPGSCANSESSLSASFTTFTPDATLSLHAAYGNQTGTVVVESSRTVNLDLTTFT